MSEILFSQKLSSWINSPDHKTIGSLEEVMAEKTFAVFFLFLMILPALPAPTGGATHVLAIINLLVAAQILIGRKLIWLPSWAKDRPVSPKLRKVIAPKLVKFIQFFEKYSKKRHERIVNHKFTFRLLGLLVMLFTLGVFFAPPFSGLDTLPALGVVIIALGLILEDSLYLLAGTIVGTVGMGLIFILGKATLHFLGL